MSEPRSAPTVGQVVLGRRLLDLRERAGLKREEAARVLRVAPATVRRMEMAEVSLKIPYLQLLLKAYGVGDEEAGLQAVHDACRKYRLTPQSLPAALQAAQAKLAELEHDLDLSRLEREIAEAQAAYRPLAAKITAARRKAAARLGRQVTSAMQELALTGGRFEVALEPLAEPTLHGMERIEFRVSPHPGMEPGPLAKIASGGELSRLSLAIQTALTEVAQVPTLIFDEVDAGIGGRVAEMVGRMLRRLGARHQVMCVTHLPQVAACAEHHWRVSKDERDGAVMSRVDALDAPMRVDEIARMLGGSKITRATREHAAEMLHEAKRFAAQP